MSLSVLIPVGSQAEGHAVARGAGVPSPWADMLKGATFLSSYQESEFYYFTDAVSALHCVNSSIQQPSDNHHVTKQTKKANVRHLPVDFSFISAQTAESPPNYI